MTTHSSILAWKIPWTEEPGGLMGYSHAVAESDWTENVFMHTCTHTHTHSFLLVILSASVLRQQSGLGAVTGGAHGGPRCGDSRHPTGPPKEVPEGTFKTSSWCFGAWEWGRGRGWNCGTALALAFVTGHLQRQLSSTPADLPDGRGSASGHHKGPASP